MVLTNTHIVVHKKAASRISEMGAFLYKVGGSPACQQANAANSECRDRRNLSKKLPGSRFDRPLSMVTGSGLSVAPKSYFCSLPS